MEQAFYNETPMDGGFYEEKINYFLSVAKDALKEKGNDIDIVDLGCYDGRFGEIMYKETGIKIDGVDISDKNLSKAGFLKNIFLINLDSCSRWDMLTKYDLVFAGDIIEHLVYTDEFMANVNRILNPGGYLVISTPNVASLGRRIMLLFGKNPFLEVSNTKDINKFPADSVGHLRYFTKETFKAIVEYHGFKVLKLHGSAYKIPLIGKMLPSSLSWHLTIVAKKIKNIE